MKLLTFLFVFGISLVSWSQIIYGSVSNTYYFVQQNDHQAPSQIINSYPLIWYNSLYRTEGYIFKQLNRSELSFGHMLNSNFGYELSLAYLKPTTITDKSENIIRTLKGDFVQGLAKFILNVPLDRFDIYTKIGVNIITGSLKFNQSLDVNTANELLWNYKYYDNFSLGFNASIGLNYRLSDRFSLFTELSFLSQSFSPKKGEVTRFSISGVNQLDQLNESPYFSQIEFGDEYQYDEVNPNNTNNNNPQKLYRRNYTLGGYGLTIGAKYVLWEKKKVEKPFDE
jgi:hypothetical protein